MCVGGEQSTECLSFLHPGIQSDSAESTKSVAERVRLAEEKKKMTDVDRGGFATRVTLTSSQSFNYPSRGEWWCFSLLNKFPFKLLSLTYCDSRMGLYNTPRIGI